MGELKINEADLPRSRFDWNEERGTRLKARGFFVVVVVIDDASILDLRLQRSPEQMVFCRTTTPHHLIPFCGLTKRLWCSRYVGLCQSHLENSKPSYLQRITKFFTCSSKKNDTTQVCTFFWNPTRKLLKNQSEIEECQLLEDRHTTLGYIVSLIQNKWNNITKSYVIFDGLDWGLLVKHLELKIYTTLG